jgi:hypothetical protein
LVWSALTALDNRQKGKKWQSGQICRGAPSFSETTKRHTKNTYLTLFSIAQLSYNHTNRSELVPTTSTIPHPHICACLQCLFRRGVVHLLMPLTPSRTPSPLPQPLPQPQSGPLHARTQLSLHQPPIVQASNQSLAATFAFLVAASCSGMWTFRCSTNDICHHFFFLGHLSVRLHGLRLGPTVWHVLSHGAAESRSAVLPHTRCHAFLLDLWQHSLRCVRDIIV